jgi:hypothetical protein
MYIRMKRRKFGRWAVSSAAVTVALANLPQKVLSQTKQLLYGMSVDEKSGSLTLYALNLASGKIDNLGSSSGLNSQERLASFSVEANGDITSVVGNKLSVSGSKVPKRNRLKSFKQQNLVELQSISESSAIESLVTRKNGRSVGLLSSNQGSPPFRLANVDRSTGRVGYITDLDLPFNQRFSNLIECADGSIYATTMGSEGSPALVKIDIQQKSIISGKSRLIYLPKLTFSGKPLENDLAGLACSASDRIYALADPNSKGVNSLFSVDLKTGVMTFTIEFPVNKIAFSRA